VLVVLRLAVVIAAAPARFLELEMAPFACWNQRIDMSSN